MDGLMDDGPGLVPMLLWTEWVSGGNVFHLRFPSGNVRMGQGGSSCLSWHPNRGEGVGFLSSEAFAALGLTRKRADDTGRPPVCGPGTTTPPGHCMTGAFFGVFGAATKCAMCYVAWFIIFLQATKLICSPIV